MDIDNPRHPCQRHSSFRSVFVGQANLEGRFKSMRVFDVAIAESMLIRVTVLYKLC